MSKKNQKTNYFSKLRQRAENELEASSGDNGYPASSSPDNRKTLIHDLQVLQIELEMQNDELKRSQEELEDSRKRYFDFYDQAPVGYITVSEKGLLLETNLTASSLLGVGRDMLVNQPIFRFILKEDQDIYYLHRKHLVETGEPQKFELRMVQTDKLQFWVKLDMTAAQHKCGVPICQIIINDITKRKQAEGALRERMKELRCLYLITDIIANTDTIEEILQKTAETITSGFNYPEIACVRITREDQEFKTENFQETEWKISTDIIVGDKTIGVIEACYIEEELFLKEERDLIIACAERLSRTMERKGLESQLIQSQKMESIGILTGRIAHDFNNLLSVIIGNAELSIMAMGKDDPLRENIEEIKKYGDKTAVLIRQLLAFSRRQIIKPGIHNFNTLLTGINKMFDHLIGEDVEFSMVPGPELWAVLVDSGQMEQVIMNLVVNARDAMPKGGKLIIETANMDLEKNYFHGKGIKGQRTSSYVMLSVTDTGTGMDKETLSHIFEPFFTTKKIGKGTGLGMSTVYGIVKQNNGFVWADSEPGQGTSIKIYFPRAMGNVKSIQEEQPPLIRYDGSENILVVEDDNGFRGFVKKVLQSHGYTILAAENGEAALRIIKKSKESIPLMITDVMMPKMNGKELADKLTIIHPHIKVIYMSGYTDDAIIASHSIFEPRLNFLEKPFLPESLARMVRVVLDT